MYPLAAIIGVGIIFKDRKLYRYVLPLSLIGAVIAFYQMLLEQGVISEALAPCSLGVSCTTKYITLFDFITIPTMSFVAFVIITVLMFLKREETVKR